MKYGLLWLLALLLAVVTVGCSNNSRPDLPDNAFASPPIVQDQKVEITDAYCTDPPSSQFPFRFTLKNITDENIEISYYWYLNDPKANSPQYFGHGNASLPALGTEEVEIHIKETREYDPRFYIMYVSVHQENTVVGYYRDQKSTYHWDYSVTPPKPLISNSSAINRDIFLAGIKEILPEGWSFTIISEPGKMGHPYGLEEPMFRIDFVNSIQLDTTTPDKKIHRQFAFAYP